MADSLGEATFTHVPGEDGQHITYCRICEALCGMVATVKDGVVVQIAPDHANPHSQGLVCVKGVSFHHVAFDQNRVLQPLKRVGGPGEFEPVTWDEALSDIARRFDRVLTEHGADAFGVIYGNPPAFGMASVLAPSMLMKALGTSKAFSPQSEDTAATLLAHELLFGGMSYVFPDLPDCDHLLIFGSNPLVSHGSLIIAPRMKEDLEAIAARGRVIVFDPRKTETARKHEHVAVRPATDVWLLAAMINVIFEESLADIEFLKKWTTGWEELRKALSAFTPERASAHCGVPAQVIRTLAIDFASAKRAAAMGRLGLCRGTFPTLSNVLLNILNIVAGKFHKEGCSGFGYGAADSGDMLASAGMVGYTANASRTSGLPAVVGSLPSVTLYDEMMAPGDGRLRAVLASGANPVMSMPGGARLPEAFANLDVFVAMDLYVTETTKHAHYILPATTFLEREDSPLLFAGHMVRPHIQYVPPVVPPRGEARTELDIVKGIAELMGKDAAFGGITSTVLIDSILRAGPEGDNGAGLTLDRLREHPHGIALSHGRWAFKLEEKLRHPDGKIHLNPPLMMQEIDRLNKIQPDPVEGLRMFSQRKLRSINSWMHNVDKLVRSDEPRLLMHPKDAQARQIVDGERVRVSTQWGQGEVVASVTDDVMAGSVCYPHGWGHNGGWQRANATPGININSITPSSPESAEQISGMSFLDGFPVVVEKLHAV